VYSPSDSTIAPTHPRQMSPHDRQALRRGLPRIHNRFLAVMGFLLAGGVGFALSMNSRVGPPDRTMPEPYPTGNFQRPVAHGHLNVSLFVYRDLGRTGSHEVRDRPLAGVAVVLESPHGPPIMRRSNIHGFVNFTNAPSSILDADVTMEGTHHLRLVPPPGWTVTSNNAAQSITYRRDPTTRPGILADRVPSPVGLAPVPDVSGTFGLPLSGFSDPTEELPPIPSNVWAIDSLGGYHDIEVSNSGSFATRLEPGPWTLSLQPPAAPEVIRRFRVGLGPIRLIGLGSTGAKLDPMPLTCTLDPQMFTTSRIGKMPNGVLGLDWNNFVPVENYFYEGEGYVNTSLFGRYVGYNTSGYPVTISSDRSFDLVGGFFGVAWASGEGEELIIKAWRDEELVHKSSSRLSAFGPLWIDADLRHIDRVEFSTQHYWQFVVDGLQLRVPSPPPESDPFGYSGCIPTTTEPHGAGPSP